jgi:hypothetical protein
VFLLTFHAFVKPEHLLDLLVLRFLQPPPIGSGDTWVTQTLPR